MEKVYCLCRRTLLNRKHNLWTSYRTLIIYRHKVDADKSCLELRNVALDFGDDTVDYCVIEFNVIDLQ